MDNEKVPSVAMHEALEGDSIRKSSTYPEAPALALRICTTPRKCDGFKRDASMKNPRHKSWHLRHRKGEEGYAAYWLERTSCRPLTSSILGKIGVLWSGT